MRYLNSAQRISDKQELMYALIDFSPSMDASDYAPTRRVGAIEANRRLIQTKARRYPQDMLGIIAFDDKAHVLNSHLPVGSDSECLCESLSQEIDYSCGTNFTSALKLAEKMLFSRTADVPLNPFSKMLMNFLLEPRQENSQPNPETAGNITRRIILLTDGEHNGGGSPVKIADRLKAAGVIIECIGIAGKPGDVDEGRLKKIASRDSNGNPMYCFIGDTNALIEKYEKIAGHLCVVKGK